MSNLRSDLFEGNYCSNLSHCFKRYLKISNLYTMTLLYYTNIIFRRPPVNGAMP